MDDQWDGYLFVKQVEGLVEFVAAALAFRGGFVVGMLVVEGGQKGWGVMMVFA